MRSPSKLLVLCIFLVSAAHAADIGVSPPRIAVTVPVGGSVTTTFDAIWTGKKAVRLDLATEDWTMAQDGRLAYLAPGESPHSAASWIHLGGAAVEMAGAGQQTIRLGIQVPNDPTLAGTYNAVVFVAAPATAGKAPGTQLSMRQRVGVVVYVTVAGTERNGSKLNDMYVDGSTVHAVVDNVGNTVMRYSGTIEVRDASGNTVNTVAIGDSAILRESERDIAIKMPDLPKGYYVLLLLLKDSRGGLLTGQLPYEVK